MVKLENPTLITEMGGVYCISIKFFTKSCRCLQNEVLPFKKSFLGGGKIDTKWKCFIQRTASFPLHLYVKRQLPANLCSGNFKKTFPLLSWAPKQRQHCRRCRLPTIDRSCRWKTHRCRPPSHSLLWGKMFLVMHINILLLILRFPKIKTFGYIKEAQGLTVSWMEAIWISRSFWIVGSFKLSSDWKQILGH